MLENKIDGLLEWYTASTNCLEMHILGMPLDTVQK
jgi:hypothetical protein